MTEVAILHALLVEQARQLRASISVRSEANIAQLERMTNIVPGDYVVEVSSFRAHEDRQDVGRLIWVQEEGPKGERVFYIEALDGTLVRWRNANFHQLFPGRVLKIDQAWVEEALARHRVEIEEAVSPCAE